MKLFTSSRNFGKHLCRIYVNLQNMAISASALAPSRVASPKHVPTAFPAPK